MDDYKYINDTGTIVPDTSQLLGAVQADFKAVFGDDLVVDPSTPQGVLITALTLSRAETVNNNAALANQINPNIAGGVFLDAIMALLGVQRTEATRTIIPGVVISGVAGTLIPSGSRAQNVAGDVFETIANLVISAAGTVVSDFRAVEFGPIVCTANSLNTIVTFVLGWETVNNPTAGVIGSNTQSDQAARAFRNNTLGFQGVALVDAITSAVYHVDNVKSLSFLENVAATTQVIQGISLVAHSIWVCVSGGTNADVAAALLENKSNGCAWNGGTTVALVEPASGQEYAVKFERPTVVPILIRVTSPNGISQNIVSAVLAWAAGELGGLQGFVVGGDVSPYEIAAGINYQYPDTFISKVEITLASAPSSWSTNTLAVSIGQLASTESSFITVLVS